MGTGRPSFLPKRLHHLGQLFSPPAPERVCLYLMVLVKKKRLIKTLLLAMLFDLHSNSVAVSHLAQIVPGVCGLLPTHGAKKNQIQSQSKPVHQKR